MFHRKFFSFQSFQVIFIMGILGKNNSSWEIFNFFNNLWQNSLCLWCSQSSVNKIILHVYNYKIFAHVFILHYSTLLSDSTISIFFNLKYIIPFTKIENKMVNAIDIR